MVVSLLGGTHKLPLSNLCQCFQTANSRMLSTSGPVVAQKLQNMCPTAAILDIFILKRMLKVHSLVHVHSAWVLVALDSQSICIGPLRKNQSLKRFHEFLKIENEIGNITRQEAVSMVPPLFLNVHSNHIVLDMGAAPANLIVTNHEAQHFPGCHLNLDCDIRGSSQHTSQLLFDRVLCDVPCSGDGTLRNAPDLWRRWNTGTGNGLHTLQILVAMQGLSLLKVGGRMVYSTCSMNPIEHEAVVAKILRRCKGSVELVDVSSELPQLIRRPGLKRWKVRDKGKSLVSCKEVDKVRRSVVLPNMFPNGGNYRDIDCNSNCDVSGHPEDVVQVEENPAMHEFTEIVSDFPLELCMRLLPHDQNSGAFFIAVLQKNSPLPAIEVKRRKEVNNQHVESVNQGSEDAQVLQIYPSERT
ncbi:hypothetical protein KIW84_074719 [Lathyrus oleraceus]|uniref:SAM-dependent MTase RsmB/NOP-type domain-containing protein n=1 Tax=Pisum sativum TaxID=3888 RepID=A0A9D4VT47_PEA|nr:hypothetical protein KIW84_074719 [Pisum sativum]